MSYVGLERRKTIQVHCIHENDWGKMTASIENLDKRINGTLHDMEIYMDSGKAWRMSIIGIILTIILQVVTFAYLWGGLSNQVYVNSSRLNNIEIIEKEALAIRTANVEKIANLEKVVTSGKSQA
jgi:hypothetical protein